MVIVLNMFPTVKLFLYFISVFNLRPSQFMGVGNITHREKLSRFTLSVLEINDDLQVESNETVSFPFHSFFRFVHLLFDNILMYFSSLYFCYSQTVIRK